MADPLEGLLDPPEPQTPPTDPPEPPAVNPEFERLRVQNEALQAQLQQAGTNLNDLRAQIAAGVAPAPVIQTGDPNEQFWQDPLGNTNRVVQQGIERFVQPQAKEINTKLGRLALNTFLGQKTGDTFFDAVSPIFNEKIKGMSLEQLGAMPDAAVQSTLSIAWDAAVGTYVQQQRSKRAPTPANLGGGGSGGGGGAKKTLAELDVQAYNTAMQAGLSAEDMQEIADSIGDE